MSVGVRWGGGGGKESDSKKKEWSVIIVLIRCNFWRFLTFYYYTIMNSDIVWDWAWVLSQSLENITQDYLKNMDACCHFVLVLVIKLVTFFLFCFIIFLEHLLLWLIAATKTFSDKKKFL